MISVVIPYYKASKYIRFALDSCLEQDTVLEVIIVDDNSQDDIDQIVKEYSNLNVNLIKLSKNQGVANARNIGAENSSGEYLAFLDADDLFMPNKLKQQLEYLSQNKADVCSTDRIIIKENGEFLGIIKNRKIVNLKNMLKENLISTSSVLLKKEVYMQFLMTNSEVHEDYLCWLKMLANNIIFVHYPFALTKYRLSNQGKSGTPFNSIKMKYLTYRKFNLSVCVSLYYTFWNILYSFLKHAFKDKEGE